MKPAPDGEFVLGGQKYLLEYFAEGQWKTLIRRQLQQLDTHWQLTSHVKFLLIAESDAQLRVVQKLLLIFSEGFGADCILHFNDVP